MVMEFSVGRASKSKVLALSFDRLEPKRNEMALV